MTCTLFHSTLSDLLGNPVSALIHLQEFRSIKEWIRARKQQKGRNCLQMLKRWVWCLEKATEREKNKWPLSHTPHSTLNFYYISSWLSCLKFLTDKLKWIFTINSSTFSSNYSFKSPRLSSWQILWITFSYVWGKHLACSGLSRPWLVFASLKVNLHSFFPQVCPVSQFLLL